MDTNSLIIRLVREVIEWLAEQDMSSLEWDDLEQMRHTAWELYNHLDRERDNRQEENA